MPFPNNESHFAAGDIVEWSGIKRVGIALRMGQCVARNLVKLIYTEQVSNAQIAELDQYPEIPAMMALSIGPVAGSYSPNVGLKFGEDVHEDCFSNDLDLAGESILSNCYVSSDRVKGHGDSLR